MTSNFYSSNSSYTSKFQNDVQQRIRSLSYGRRATSKKKAINRGRMVSNKHVSKYELDEFFNRTNDQLTRITSNQRSDSIENNVQLRKSPKVNGKKITSTDICSLVSHVANKMSQSKQKADLQPLRGFRLPSTTYGDEPDSRKKSSIRKNPIRLIDILPKNNSSEQRTCPSAASSLSKTSVHFFSQRQNTSFE